MIGTLVNAVTVFIGGTLGTFLGSRFPARMQETIFAALGLFTLFIGMSSAFATGNALIVLGSLLVGGLIGEAIQLEAKLERFGEWLRDRLVKGGDGGAASRFVEGFVTASLVFCVGPLTVLGSIQDGLTGDYNLLAIKSVLDGFAALAFAATMGPGVLLSILTIILLQGGISLAAMTAGGALGEVTRQTPWVIEMTAAGGVLMLGISLMLLELRRIRVANLLPAVFIAPLIQLLLQALGVG